MSLRVKIKGKGIILKVKVKGIGKGTVRHVHPYAVHVNCLSSMKTHGVLIKRLNETRYESKLTGSNTRVEKNIARIQNIALGDLTVRCVV